MNCLKCNKELEGIYTHIEKVDDNKYKRIIVYRCFECGMLFDSVDFLTFDEVFNNNGKKVLDEDEYVEHLEQEIEKLKMSIEILKEHIHICRNSCFYKIVLNGETELSLLDYELLKEVLGNE